jgi:signal recognition particle receptor subunit beta
MLEKNFLRTLRNNRIGGLTMSQVKIESTSLDEDFKYIQIKIMYWGPGESGKTTNFQRIQEIFAKNKISSSMSIQTTDNRTLWNDSVTIQFTIQSIKVIVIVMVNTTTGQERFLTTREYILANTDGVVFVGDSDRSKLDETKRSFDELVAFTRDIQIPISIQLNKRDLPNAINIQEFLTELGLPNLETDKDGNPFVYQAIAKDSNNDLGVKDCFLDLITKILKNKLTQ